MANKKTELYSSLWASCDELRCGWMPHNMVQGIKELMQRYKHQMRDELPKIYSQGLINNLFRHPYAKIGFVVRELQVHRNTATKYLEELVAIGLLKKHKIGKDNYYLNAELYNLLLNVILQGGEEV